MSWLATCFKYLQEPDSTGGSGIDALPHKRGALWHVAFAKRKTKTHGRGRGYPSEARRQLPNKRACDAKRAYSCCANFARFLKQNQRTSQLRKKPHPSGIRLFAILKALRRLFNQVARGGSLFSCGARLKENWAGLAGKGVVPALPSCEALQVESFIFQLREALQGKLDQARFQRFMVPALQPREVLEEKLPILQLRAALEEKMARPSAPLTPFFSSENRAKRQRKNCRSPFAKYEILHRIKS
jgi:hypothetical protein